jgi:hypothetical protein
MIFKQLHWHAGVLLALLLLAGCPGNEDNTVEAGLRLHFAEVHGETRPGGTALEASGVSNSAVVTGGYAQDQIEHHTLQDRNGRLLSLYRAYLVLADLELVRCPSLSRLPDTLLDFFVGNAQAHAGHGSAPVGGRALDKPNVIDIIAQDEFILPLGDVAVAPGNYCGVKLALVRLAGEAYGQPTPVAASTDDPTTLPEVPDLAGHMFALRADYCAQTDSDGLCVQRVKVDVDDAGLAEPVVVTLDFAQPLVLNATLREAYVAIGIAYGEWLHDVDITLLASDSVEKQKLFTNLADSLHIHAQGWGSLPANLAP